MTDNIFPTSYYSGSCRDDPDGGDGYVTCLTDNSTLTYYMDSGGTYELEAVDKSNVRATMNNDYEPTDLSVSYDSSPSFSGSAETDIIYQEGSTNIPSSSDGVTWCNDAVDGNGLRCDQQYVRIRGHGAYTRGMSCHETGHAVGLLHGSDASPRLSKTDSRLGCLVTPVGENTGLGSNNRDNINGVY